MSRVAFLEVTCMFDVVRQLAQSNLLLLAGSALIFDVPRYTVSLISLAAVGIGRLFRDEPAAPGSVTVSVIIPTFNGGSGLAPTIASLRRQTFLPLEIIVIDDGSTDNTRAVAVRARALGLIDVVICHGTRCGRSPALNHGARFARGDLLFTVDADTVFRPDAIARLVSAFADPRVAGVAGNIAISNVEASIWTVLQSTEYLMSISAGKSVLDTVGAVACLSGACSMYRRDVFVRQGGLDVGPGEDLEFSLRLRRVGYLVRFVPQAWAETDGPVKGLNLLRQRARWDRDALRIRFMMYGELRLFRPFEHLRDTLQRLDFILFDLIPTLTFPFYLVYLVLLLGPDAGPFLVSIYILLLWISLLNLVLAYLVFGQSPGVVGFGVSLIFPFYQGVYMKCARFVAYSTEIMFAASRHDDFVPPRVRRALIP